MAIQAIPVNLESFDGHEENLRGITKCKKSITPKYNGGNKCNHKKDNPVNYLTPTNQKTRPYIIEKLKRALEKFYFRPEKFLKELQKRSERREAIMRVLQCIFDYTDLITLKVKSITINFLSKQTGLGYKRIVRALHDLKIAGYIFIQRSFKRLGQDDFIGLASIKTISLQLLYKLGIKQKELAKYQKKKLIESQIKEIENESIKEGERLISFYETMKNKNQPSSAAKTITEHIQTIKNLLKIKF